VTERRSHRSKAVPLLSVPVLAVAFTACGDDGDETAYCVDQNDQIVENRYCDDEAYGGGGPGAFFWFYGGSVVGNSGAVRVSASNVAENARRGGFGSSSRGTTSSGGIGKSVASGRSSGG
jgi:hypothetical protein